MGKELTKSAFHASFIYDIIKKEYQADALYTLAMECQYKAENIRREGENCRKQAEAKVLESKKQINMRENDLNAITKYKKDDGTYPKEYVSIYETKYRKKPKSFFSFGRLAVIILMSFFVSLPLTAWMLYSLKLKYTIFEEFYLLFIGGLIGFTLLLTLIINSFYILIVPGEEETYTVEKEKIDKFAGYPWKETLCIEKLEYAKQQYEVYQEEHEVALDVYRKSEKGAIIMEKCAKNLKNLADCLKSDQQKMFDMNVIPPDYRDLRCLFELHRIFYNNLADTMREAIAIYEERVFRGIVVKGIYQLNNKFGLISEYIVDVKDELHRISRDTDFMSGEIQRIRENQDNQNDKQDQMIEEMRATRYANEAVKESQERCEWYMNYHFWNK